MYARGAQILGTWLPQLLNFVQWYLVNLWVLRYSFTSPCWYLEIGFCCWVFGICVHPWCRVFQDTFTAALARASPHSWSCLFYLHFPFTFNTKCPSSHPCCAYQLFLVTFIKLQKSYCWLRHVHLSSWNNSASTGQFARNLIFEFFFNLSRKFKFH